MVVKKKPYFFIYLYKTLMDSYKTYKKIYNGLCYKLYKKSINDLILKNNKADSEANFLREYKRYSPVLETDCLMNILCKELESIEFDIAYKKNSLSIIQEFRDRNFEPNELILNKLYELYKEFNSTKSFKGVEKLVESEGIKDDNTSDIIGNIMYRIKDNIRQQMIYLVSNSKDLYNYLIIMCEKYQIKKYDIVWDIMRDDILDIIPYGKSYIAIESCDGNEYLGKKYIVEEAYNDNI